MRYKMFDFDNYTVVIYETAQEFHESAPECRFVAYLKEVPEASLHEYGPTREASLKNLRKQFDFFVEENHKEGIALPQPECRDMNEFSGKLMLRMPPWLHKQIDELADLEGISTNSYIVNRLIRETALDEMVKRIIGQTDRIYRQLFYENRLPQMTVEYEKNEASQSARLYHISEAKSSYHYKNVI